MPLNYPRHPSGLIEAGVPEGILVEYKRQTYARNNDGVKECLKDVSSFANSAGGHPCHRDGGNRRRCLRDLSPGR